MVAMRRARLLLNKIAFETFQRHVQAFRELLADAEPTEYNEIIELIGHHAFEGRGDFVMLYSMLLRDLSNDNDVFKEILLDRIQLAFRFGLESDNDKERSEFMIIVELIAWLCRNGTVSPCTIKALLDNAFMQDTPVALEAICRLLMVIKNSHEKLFAPYFNRLPQAWSPRFPNRLRFLVLDVLELRERRWFPRHPSDYLPMMTISDFRHYILKQPTG